MSRGRLIRVVAGAPAIALVLSFIVGEDVFAASGGCLLHPAKLSDDVVKAFKDQPGDLFPRHPASGPPLSAEVRRLVGSDVSTVAAIITLARGANTVQVVAIGTGLARAAQTCSRTRPDIEEEIKKAVAAAGILELSVAFAAGLTPFARPMGPDPTPVAAATPIGSLALFIAPSRRGSAPGGPAPADGSSTTDSVVTFGNGGVLYTFGRSVSPSR
jgi:hypothetical protein